MSRPLAKPPAVLALRGGCPRCGAPTLFASLIGFAGACPKCGLDFTGFDVGDAAAPFLIFIIGTIVVVAAIWVELAQSPPWWLHVVLWVPLTLMLTLAALRFAKGLLAALEYRSEARLGRRHE